MFGVLHTLFFVSAGFLGLFSAYQFILFLISLAYLPPKYSPRSAADAARAKTRFVVIVPAHDEELLIGHVVDSILKSDYPSSKLELIVVADNCSDRTAEIARARGAQCLERFDETLRGKPHALDWVVQRLDLEKYDALVIIDADTTVAPDFFLAMDAQLQSGKQALQGYFGVMNPDQTWLTRLSLLPATLKFRLHYPAKEALGLSCPLAGNGMCFEIGIIKRFGWRAYSLTENWEYWAMLALAGIRVGSAPDAMIYAQEAASLSSSQSQRMRWMRGRIETLRNYAPKLLAKFRPATVDAVIELAKPAHAMLLLWSVALLAAAVLAAAWDPEFRVWALTAGIIVLSQLIYLLAGFAIDKPPLKTWAALVMVPWYLIWKLLVSIKGLFALRERTWVRTKRHEL